MKIMSRTRFLALLLASLGLISAHAAIAQQAVLESAALRLELSAAPYSYAVIEKSTGTVLVRQSQTSFTVGSARSVTGASVTGQSATTLDATLTLAGTTDTAHVSFAFASPEVLQVRLTYDSGTPTNVKEQFADQGERYYGVWGIATTTTGVNLDLRGANRDLIGITNGNAGTINGNVRAPFYVTSRNYGIWADSEAKGHYTIAVSGQTSFDFDAPQLTYNVIYGPSYAQVFYRYNGLAGGAFMPPLYAFDVFWWRDDHTQDFAANGVTSMQGLVLKDADQLQANQIPASAMWIDRPVGTQLGGGLVGWGNFDFNTAANGFADPAGMIGNLESRGMHLLVWIANRANNSMLTDPLFAPYRFTTGCPSNCTTTPAIDLRNPIPYQHFKDKLDLYADLGVRGYKIDRGEEGELPTPLMNEFTVLVHKMAYEQLYARYGAEAYQFARNNYDRSRKYASTWNGDTSTNFAGLIQSVKMATRSGAINFPMSGSDTGGYTGAAPNKEVFARWLGFSSNTSIMEVLLGPNRTPWNPPFTTGANANPPTLVDIARKHAQEHHDLIPYVRSALYNATQTGMPVMRMMPFVFPNDASVGDMWDEYMFGDALLVAPVTTAGATSRSVYLPAGTWYDYNDKLTRLTGPSTIAAAAPLDVIPRYVKAGSIIPRGDIFKSNNNWTANWAPDLRIEFFPAQGITSGFDYYNGTALIPIRGARMGNVVTLKFNNPGIDGKVEMYAIGGVNAVVRNGQALSAGTDYQYDATTQKLTIPYTGATALVVTVSG